MAACFKAAVCNFYKKYLVYLLKLSVYSDSIEETNCEKMLSRNNQSE